MRCMTVPRIRTVASAAAIAAGIALGIAWVSEHWGGFAPCALCLLERWPYRGIILVGLIAAVLPHGAARALLWFAVLLALVGAALATVHVGVELHLWPSPLPECAAPKFDGGSIADMLKAMPTQPAKPCNSANYLIPGLPVSMAAMNLLFAAAFALLLAGVLWRSGQDRS